MLAGIEDVLLKENPDALVVYGDTNSTLAGALAAAKLGIPVVHIEAGLRSFNKQMPEEVNRIATDHVSTLLFSPTQTGFNNLLAEGFKADTVAPYTINNSALFHCGDLMLDNSLHFGALSDEKSTILNQLELGGKPYVLATIHRDANTDDAHNLTTVFAALNAISVENNVAVVLPLHPRTRKLFDTNVSAAVKQAVEQNKLFKVINPVGFLDMLALEKNAKLIATDSGGVQKEAYFFNKPGIILRPETEWVEIVEAGAAIVTGANYDKIVSAYSALLSMPIAYKPIFGDGRAAEFICSEIIKNIKPRS
jgi:UDP-GlcNAc3NAcA epimerase